LGFIAIDGLGNLPDDAGDKPSSAAKARSDWSADIRIDAAG
jgi:hypothetical protein